MLIQGARVYLAVGATDLRKSIDGLSVIVQEQFRLDPFSRSLFVFCNRNRDKVKVLVWDLDGFWLHYKRLEKGRFQWPQGKREAMTVDPRQFQWLLSGLSLHQPAAHQAVKERQIL